MKKRFTIPMSSEHFGRPVQWLAKLGSFALLTSLLLPLGAAAQSESTAAFIEDSGLVVMQTESVPRPFNWKFESTEEGHTGDGYLRYIGANHFGEPGIDILEYDVVIENPGEYKMFLWLSHMGAPEPDQENDVWSKMDDGEWIKTVHPGVRIDEGFSFHTQWVQIVDGVEIFSEPTYQLDAGVHTFQISGRSWNARIDRIHIWKNDAPFKVSYDVAAMNTHPESERDNTILTVSPDPITFSSTAIGFTSSVFTEFANEGDDPINVSNITFSGTDAADFSSDFSGSLTIAAGGSQFLDVDFEPSSQGTKVATMEIVHDGLNSPTNVNIFGTATSGGSGTTVLFRVNAGGPLISDAAGDWEEDQTAILGHDNGTTEVGTPHPFVNAVANGDWAFGRSDAITLDFSVPPGTPAVLFQSGRWDPTNLPVQEWNIPVDQGKEIEVRLYFAEQLFTAPDVPVDQGWPRLFDVEIDGVVYAPFDDLNIFEEAGHDVGIMRSVVIISDGNLDINLLNDSHDPIVQAIEVLEVGSISRAMNSGWNLVGVPTNPSNDNYANVFNEVSPVAEPFGWDGNGYVQTATVESGEGYWINLSSAGSQSFSDEAVTSLSLNLATGWNLVSGPGCVVALDDVTDNGNIMIDGTFFSYDGGYQQSAAFLPGAGYWIQASSAGTVSMNCTAAPNKVAGINKNDALNLDAFGQLSIADNDGKTQALLFGASLDASVDMRMFSMPPRGPEGDFDVRFSDNTRLSQEGEQYIRIQTDAYPVSVELDRKPQAILGDVIVEEMNGSEVVRTQVLYSGEAITILDEEVNVLRISTRSAGDVETLPDAFTLKGNYPNPFNPTTQIVFDMPEAGVVKVEVYDLLGRNVMSLPAQEMSAGVARQMQIDASGLASGTYLYHVTVEMQAASLTQVGRMTLLK